VVLQPCQWTLKMIVSSITFNDDLGDQQDERLLRVSTLTRAVPSHPISQPQGEQRRDPCVTEQLVATGVHLRERILERPRAKKLFVPEAAQVRGDEAISRIDASYDGALGRPVASMFQRIFSCVACRIVPDPNS